MEFRRALRILAARWWMIALAGVVGVIVALMVANVVNSSIEPDFAAKATVEYIRLESESGDDFRSRLSEARSSAVEILDDPSEEVTVDGEAGVLTFSVTGSQPEVLAARASRLRDEFLSLESDQQRFEEATTAELERLQGEIDQVRAELQAREPAAPQVNAEVAAEREQLSFEIASLRQKIASLRIQIAFPELATTDVETLEAELERSQELLVRLTEGLAALPTESTTPTTQALDTLVLQRYLQDLEARYVSFSLGLLEQPDVIGPVRSAFVIDNTREEIGRRLAAAFGLVAGVVVMVAVLLASDRVRRSLWTADDLQPITTVGVLDRARPGANGTPWYPRSMHTARRRQVQAFRAALDPVVGNGAVSVGIVGLPSVPTDEVQALAADLAASVAASGTRVVLVDAAFGDPAELPEYGADKPDLAELLSTGDPMSAAAAIKAALTERSEIVPDLVALRSGSGVIDATDALAGPNLKALLNTAAELDEVLIMAAAPFGDPGTDVLSQRLDHILLVARARVTRQGEYRDAVDELSGRSARLSGAALLIGRPSRTRRPRRSILAGVRGSGRHVRSGAVEDAASAVSDGPDDEAHATSGELLVERSDPTLKVDAEDGDIEPDALASTDHGEQEAPQDDDQAPVSAAEQHAIDRGRPRRHGIPDGDSRLDPVVDQGRHVRLMSEPVSGGKDRSTEAEFDAGLEIVIDDRDASPSDREQAERYLVEKVLSMLGVGEDQHPGAVTEEGVVLITLEDGEPNAAETLQAALDADEAHRSWNVERGLRALFDGRISAWQLHKWLEDHFFDLHVETSDGTPEVWHVSSSERTFQALVRADVFDAEHIQIVRNRVRKTISRLGDALSDAGRDGDMERVRAIEERFNEVRLFDAELFELWRKEWKAGDRLDRGAKLAVLQGLGMVDRPDARSSVRDTD